MEDKREKYLRWVRVSNDNKNPPTQTLGTEESPG